MCCYFSDCPQTSPAIQRMECLASQSQRNTTWKNRVIALTAPEWVEAFVCVKMYVGNECVVIWHSVISKTALRMEGFFWVELGYLYNWITGQEVLPTSGLRKSLGAL